MRRYRTLAAIAGAWLGWRADRLRWRAALSGNARMHSYGGEVLPSPALALR